MPWGRIIQVDPGELRLPPGRFTGSDPLKLSRQIQELGSSMAGMPPIQVTEGAGGERMINDLGDPCRPRLQA